MIVDRPEGDEGTNVVLVQHLATKVLSRVHVRDLKRCSLDHLGSHWEPYWSAFRGFMCFQISKRSFDQTVKLTCKDRLGLELHNMAVRAIMKDAIDTAYGHASSLAVWLLCRQRLQLLAQTAHTFRILFTFGCDAPKYRHILRTNPPSSRWAALLPCSRRSVRESPGHEGGLPSSHFVCCSL